MNVKLTNHSVLYYIKVSLKVFKASVISVQFLINSGRLLNSFDALSWKVLFSVRKANLMALLERMQFLATLMFYYY